MGGRAPARPGFFALLVGSASLVALALFAGLRLVGDPPRADSRLIVSEAATQLSALPANRTAARPPWPEHPRPGLRRPSWLNLNGDWSFRVMRGEQEGSKLPARIADAAGAERKRGTISVPFAIESDLGGVRWKLAPDEAIWYERNVEIGVELPASRRYFLHFEAVDYECTAVVNGVEVGRHRGGNTPFTFEVTDSLKAGTNVIVVLVEDKMGLYQLGGKQTPHPKAIWYSPSSGIVGTVWLEEVPETYIQSMQIGTTSLQPSPTIELRTDVRGSQAAQAAIVVAVLDSGSVVASRRCSAEACSLQVPGARLWTPDSPHLYELQVELYSDSGNKIDQVTSYTGIRTVGKKKDANGDYRFTLNGEFIFHWGPLDQGWWPRGGLTPDSEEDMLSDVEFLKAAGFNMIRKHTKVEPRRYYYHCDRLGMLVWQDQVAAPGCVFKRTECSKGQPPVTPEWVHGPQLGQPASDAEWPEEEHRQFMAEFAEMIDALGNSPSVVVWTPFNEAWGQHSTVEVGKWVQERDPTRLLNIASGGNFFPIGDIVDRHNYPSPAFDLTLPAFKDYVKVVGEYGGLKQVVAGHAWSGGKNWGYDSGADALLKRYTEALRQLVDLVKKRGVAGAVYTQTTDVEGELNGLLTYDRQVQKISAKQLRQVLADSGLFRVAQQVAGPSAA